MSVQVFLVKVNPTIYWLVDADAAIAGIVYATSLKEYDGCKET